MVEKKDQNNLRNQEGQPSQRNAGQINKKYHILFIEDDLVDQKALERYLKSIPEFCTFDIADSLAEAKEFLGKRVYDTIVSDHSLGDGNSFDVLEDARNIPIIVTTGAGDEQLAVEMMKMGVYDYLIKDTEGQYLKTLPVSITNAIEKKRNEDEIKQYRFQLESLVQQRTQALEEKIEELREAENKISKARDFYHSLLHTFPSLVWRCDTDGKCDYFNQTWLDFTGKTLEQEKGMGWAEGVHPEDYDRCVGKFLEALDKREPFELEYRLRRNDGEYRWIIDFGRPHNGFDGVFAGYLGSCYDITATKKATRELISARREAEQSSKLKSVLLANMSHEFRTPMNGILGYTSVLLTQIKDEQHHTILKRIKKTGNRLMATLNSVLELASLTTQNGQMELQTIDMKSSIQPVVMKYRAAAMEKGLHYDYILEPNLKVSATEELIAQICENLLDNAIKFTEKGKVSLEVSSIIKDGKNYGLIKVRDTGIGISPKHKDIIFDEFRQASEGYGRSFEGSGLGLTLTKKIVENLAGTISVNSRLGEGSEFKIEIPAFEVNEPPAIYQIEQTKTEEKNVGEFENRTLPYVLVVEDNDVNRDIIELFLEDVCNLKKVASGHDAIESVKKDEFDIILMDINLGPGIDGVETTKRIKKIPGYENIPIVAVTGYASVDDKEKLLSEGLTHYLSKPFDQDQIVNLIHDILVSA